MKMSEDVFPRALQILLADDDTDDCLLFQEVLDELTVDTKLSTVHDGEQLMQFLSKKANALPDVIFLDLNMPRKNGFACLEELKRDSNLKHLRVIIFSTSYEKDIADLLFHHGAHYYICKPPTFANLKEVIHQAISLVMQSPALQPARGKFLLNKSESLVA
jgi:CheY-like chemotaxis protein